MRRCASLWVLLLAAPVRPLAARAEGPGSSYLNVSFEAQEKLQKAEREEGLGRWSLAASSYQAVAESHGDFLTPIAPGSGRYISVRAYANQRMAAWPRAGLDAYRSMCEEPAEARLAEIREGLAIEPLLRLAEDYFATDSGAAALEAAAELAIERGELQSARQWYSSLITHHPAGERHEPTWRAKRAMCALWQGDAAPLKELSARFNDRNPGPSVIWEGRETSVGAFAKAVLDEHERRRTAAPGKEIDDDRASTSAAVFCGDAARRGYYETSAVPAARLWRFGDELSDHGAAQEDRNEAYVANREALQRSLESGRLLAQVPVADRAGRVFWYDGGRVRAVDSEAPDAALWDVRPSPTAIQQTKWMNEDEPPEQFTVLLDGGRLYVPLEAQRGQSGGDARRIVAGLLCLDADTGEVIWNRRLDEIGSRFEHVLLDGAPLMHQGKLFAVARRRKAFGFEACLLLCLNPEDGRLLWQTHVGEAPTGSYGYYRPTRSHPAAAGDLVFVSSNLGTVAAVSATTGRAAWLSCYRSQYADPSQLVWPTRFGRPIRSWHYQPVMVWGDAIVSAPLDGDELLVLDQIDGAVRSSVRLDRLFHPECFLGLDGDRLYCVGTQVVCYDLAADRMVWQRPLAEGQIFGRGAVTSQGVLVPTDRALLRYPLDGGPAESLRWSLEEAGNVVPLADQIVVASAAHVAGLVGRAEAFQRLARRMEARPGDHQSALALADLAFESGDYERGLRAAEAAVKRMGAEDAVEDAPGSRILFDRFLGFAVRIMSKGQRTEEEPTAPPVQSESKDSLDARLDAAARLLGMAERCAGSRRDRIVTILLLAKARLMHEQPEAAIESYQRILADRQLRSRNMTPPPESLPTEAEPEASETAGGSVGRLVTNWIGAIVTRHGPGAYERTEAQARERLENARQTSDLDALAEMMAAFPNSDAAIEARLVHARLAAAKGESAAALRSYRRFLDHGLRPDRPEVLREFVLRLLELGRIEEADEWLERGARDHPGHRFEHEGRTIGFERWREALADRLKAIGGPGPKLSPPLSKQVEQIFSDRVTVLGPMFDTGRTGAGEMLLVFADGRIDARTPVGGRSLWAASHRIEDQPMLLWSGERLFVFSTAHRLFALRREDGGQLWQFGESPPDDPRLDPEASPAWNNHVVSAGRLVVSSERGEVVCLDMADGNLRWRLEAEGLAGQMAASADHVCLTRWSGRDVLIGIYDGASGRRLRDVAIEESRPFSTLAFSPDGLLLGMRSRSIVAIRPESGEIVWQIATRRHFSAFSMQMAADGLFVTEDGRRVAKHDWQDGELLWQSAEIGAEPRGGLWVQQAGGRLLVASGDALVALDTADGRELWSVKSAFDPQIAAPLVAERAVVGLSPRGGPQDEAAINAPAEYEATDPPGEAGPMEAGAEDGAKRRYSIRAFRLTDGAEILLAGDRPLVTQPLASFGGMYLRDGAVIVLDGNRMIAHTGE